MQTDIIDQTMWAVSLQFDRRGFDSAPDLQPSQRFSFIALLDEAEVISVIFHGYTLTPVQALSALL